MDNGFSENDFVTLTDEDGEESEFQIIGIREVDGRVYYALVPLEETDEFEYVILKAEKDENGEDILGSIEDDDELDRIADIFEDELFSEIDHDEDDEEDE